MMDSNFKPETCSELF